MKRILPLSKIVIHHSVSPRDADFEKSILSFDRNHAVRLRQDRSSLGFHIAYHYVIGSAGQIKHTRADDEIGYHASNWIVNLQSVGICLVGNFDNEEPTTQQIAALDQLLANLKKKYSIKPDNISGHRKYAPKSCPGKNINDKMIGELAFGIYELQNTDAQPSEWAKQAWDIATEKGIVHGDPQGDLNIRDAEVILNRLGVINQIEARLTRERFIVSLYRLGIFDQIKPS